MPCNAMIFGGTCKTILPTDYGTSVDSDGAVYPHHCETKVSHANQSTCFQYHKIILERIYTSENHMVLYIYTVTHTSIETEVEVRFSSFLLQRFFY